MWIFACFELIISPVYTKVYVSDWSSVENSTPSIAIMSMIRLIQVVLVLMYASRARARSITPASGGTGRQYTGNPNETESCMIKFLQLLTPTVPDIRGKELVLTNFPRTVVDEENTASTPLLAGVLGSAEHAQRLADCLSGQVKACQQRHPCSNAGKCIFSASVANRGAFRCRCEAGYTGLFCQTVLPLCVGNPCQNGGTCEETQGRYQCHCLPLFSGQHCEQEWLNQRKVGEIYTALEHISKEMQQLKTEVETDRRQDVDQIGNFLQNMEQRVVASMNSGLEDVSLRLRKVESNQADVIRNITSIWGGLDFWIYRGILLKAAKLPSNADNIPSPCSPYQPGNSAWGRSDYIAICEHFAPAGTACGNLDTDADGGLCNNYQALLSFENNVNPDVWLNSGSFSYSPSNANPADCDIYSGTGTVVYACRF